MNRIIAIGMVAMMMIGGLMVFPDGITQNTKAETISYVSNIANVGSEKYTSSVYNDCILGLNGAQATTFGGTKTESGASKNPFDYTLSRSFISFAINKPSNAEVISAKLFIKTSTPSFIGNPVGNIDVHSRAATETVFNWTNMPSNNTFQGVLVEPRFIIDSKWYSIDVSPDSLSVADFSADYGAHIDTVYYVSYSESEAGNTPATYEKCVLDLVDLPYLVITYSAPLVTKVRYYEDMASFTDVAIYPVEIIDNYNNTHDLVRFEVLVLNETTTDLSFYPCEWMEITVGGGFTFLSSDDPSAIITTLNATTGVFNITNYMGAPSGSLPGYPDHYMMLWFAREKPVIYAEVNLALWHSTLGEGFDWTKFKIMRTDGPTYNVSTAQWIPNPKDIVIKDRVYTYTVMDYFNNPIVNKTINANAYIVNCLIPVPIYAVYLNSLRNDTVLYAVYFNGSGMPFQGHTNAYRETTLALRYGYFMFRFDYMQSNASGFNTLIDSFFYNVTINATHTFNLGQDKISVLITLINGANYNIANILTGITPSINYAWANPFPEIPAGGTRTPSSLTAAEQTYVDYNAFQIIDGQIRLNGTGTNVSLVDASPTNGTVRWLSDELYLSSYPSTHVMVNDSTGNILDLTTATPYLDIASYDLGDITVWANQTISVSRQSVFRQVQRIIYSTVPSTGYYYASATVYNPSAQQWKPVYWYIGYAVNPTTGEALLPDVSKIELYDVDNAVTLQPGRHYNIETTAVSMMFLYINTTASRTMTLRYYLDNGTPPLSMPILSIRSYEIGEYRGNQRYMGSVIYTNRATAAYSGGIQISLKGLANSIKASSLVVYDVTNDREINDEFWSFSGTTIMLSSEIVGTVEVSDSIEYAIYFEYDIEGGEPFFIFDGAYNIGWLNLNWHLFIGIIGLCLAMLGVGDFIVGGGKGKENRKLEARGVVLILASCFILAIYFALFVWHSMGAL